MAAKCKNTPIGQFTAAGEKDSRRTERVPPEENRGSERELMNPEGEPEPPAAPTIEAQNLPQIHSSTETLTPGDRAALYCDQILGTCTAEEADEVIALYVIEKISKKHSWSAVWKTTPEVLNCDSEDVGVLVQVSCTPCEGKALPFHVTVSVAEPFSSNVTNLPRELVEEVLKKNDYSVPILDVYPVQGLGSEVDDIAEALEHVRFFYDFLWRWWDDEEECPEYAGLIEKRLQLYYDMQDGTIPGPISKRYHRTLEDYHSKRLELTKFQSSIRGEVATDEAVECWKKYYEMSMLCGLLKFWEDLGLRSYGTFLPRIYKHRKGHRSDGKTVTHFVAQIMTTDMIKNFSSDILIQQHDSLEGALVSCFSGDKVVLFPGKYQADSLASVTEDIHIKGAGERNEVVIISTPSSDNFVASKASRVTLQNLTLVQRGTCDGIVVVESGQMRLENCILKCEGSGVCVLTGACLFMTNCEVTGAQGAGIELHPGSVAELHKNEIHHCSSQTSKDLKKSLGGISMKFLPQPQLKMTGNYIHNNNGYGVTILVPDKIQNSPNEGQEATGSGDRNETDQLARAIQKLSLEISANTLECNSLGEVGLLCKTISS